MAASNSSRWLELIEKEEKKRRIYLTVLIMASYICLGIFNSIPGPTLHVLKQGVGGVKTESIAVIFTTRSIGYICGYIIGGLAFDGIELTLRRRNVIILFQFLCALTSFAVPFCQNLTALSLTFFAAGLFLSALDTGFNTYMLQIWGRKSSPYLLTLHFVYSLGSLIGPTMAVILVEDVSSLTATANTTRITTPHDIGTKRFPSLLYVYIALSVMTLFVASVWIITLCLPCDEIQLGATKIKENIKVPTMKFTLFAVVTTCFLIFCTGCIDVGYQHMLATYALEGYKLSTGKTVSLTALFWGFYTTGGFLAIFTSRKFHPFFMILICLILEVLAGLILITLSKKDNVMLVIGNALLALGSASMCGWSMIWLDRYIITTYKIVSALFIMESLAEMIIPRVLAAALQKDTNSLSYFVFSVPIFYSVVLSIQCVWFFPHGEKFVSASDLPEVKRSKRYFPIISAEPKGNDETEVEEQGEIRLKKKDEEEITETALTVTKPEDKSKIQVTFVSDLKPKNAETGVHITPTQSQMTSTQDLEETEEDAEENSDEASDSQLNIGDTSSMEQSLKGINVVEQD